MTNPTSNFGWQMPTSTDLVTDLPADFEVFGQAVDTSLADLKGGTTGQVLAKATNADMDFTWVAQDDSNAIQNAIVDAKGDLIAASAADTPARLAVGTNGQVLTADSTAATGLAWSTISSGGMTLLSTTSLTSGASVTVNSISGSYNQLFIEVIDYYASAAGGMACRFNSDATSNAYQSYFAEPAANTVYPTATPWYYTVGTSYSVTTGSVKAADTNNYTQITIDNYAGTTARKQLWAQSGIQNAGSNEQVNINYGFWNNTSAITSFTLFAPSGNWTQGTLKIWGVK